MVELQWRRASVRGIEVDIPRTLTKRSQVLPLPGGEGGVRGKALFDSPSRLPSFNSLLFHLNCSGFARAGSCFLPKKGPSNDSRLSPQHDIDLPVRIGLRALEMAGAILVNGCNILVGGNVHGLDLWQ